MPTHSYLIIGSGVFGASTALALIRKHPTANITLIDRDSFSAPYRVAASWDWNKVIRADYSDILYTKLGLEAQHLWRNDPIWKPFYHESGVMWISPSTFAEKVLRNFKDLGVEVDIKAYEVEEARQLYGGMFEDADYTDVKQVLVNKSSGWAEAKEALRNTIEAAFGLGVKYVTAEVSTLEFDGARCCGVKTASGEVLTADKVILCTGAFTPKLLINSAPDRTDLHAGDRIIAAAVAEAIAPLGAEQRKILDTMPVAINDNPVEHGCDLGCLPLPNINALKYWGQIIFRNTLEHPATHALLSMPPPDPGYAQWDVPPTLKTDVRRGPESMFGRKKFDQELEKFRICWHVSFQALSCGQLMNYREALTPSQDFIISPHSACEGLYLATCGSFHGFKFLPILGKYVVKMLEGELNPELAKRWGWDRELPSVDGNSKWPKRELGDLAVGD